jgi:hypothetical protein
VPRDLHRQPPRLVSADPYPHSLPRPQPADASADLPHRRSLTSSPLPAHPSSRTAQKRLTRRAECLHRQAGGQAHPDRLCGKSLCRDGCRPSTLIAC